MRIVFIGRDNSFNRKYLNELFKEHEIVCCLFVEIDRFTFKGRSKKIKNRIKRKGLLRVIDELAFQFYSSFILRGRKEKKLKRSKPDYFVNELKLECPTYQVSNVHSKNWLELIKNHKPDIIFSICCNVIFRPKLLEIPRLGTYILHEGITPEYKGLHTPIWALLNGDLDCIGYSVIKANSEIDGGVILDQGAYNLKKDEGLKTWSWVGHNALIEGLPQIKEAFNQLELEGGFEPINTEGRKNKYYTWVTLSSFISERAKRLFAIK